MVSIANKTRSRIDERLVERVASFFLKKYKVGDRELSVAFIGDVLMKRINGRYRDKNKATDVLSFRGEGDFFGEILIDYAQIKRQSALKKKAVKSELVFILVHGLLHLAGMDDKTEEQAIKMDEITEAFILIMKKRKII